MKRRPSKLLLVVLMLVSTATPAGAYWDDVHYSLTYFIARIVGFTPLQAYRIAAANLSTDYSAATEPVQMTKGEMVGAKAGLVDASAPEKQEPRWRYHAFRNVLEFTNVIGKGAGATRADAAISQQARALIDDAVNPGVFLHFAQDRVPHNEFGSDWGHYFDIANPVGSTDEARRQNLPIGGAVDWASYQPKKVVVDLVYNTAKWLDQFMTRVSPHQRRNEYTFAGADDLIDGLRGGPRPVPLTENELQAYEAYAEWQKGAGVNPNLPAAQASNFYLHVWGPDLKRASALVDKQLRDMGMPDRAPDYEAARTKYTLDRLGHPVAALDISGKPVPVAMDEWVLSGDLELAINGITGTDPWDPLESTCRHASLSIL